jgi:hypothetical protein
MRTARRTGLSRVSFHKYETTINSYLSLRHALTDLNMRSLAYFTPYRDIFFPLFDASVHTERTRVATITRLKSGSWRVQVRRKGKYVNETFLRRKDAEEWGIDIERRNSFDDARDFVTKRSAPDTLTRPRSFRGRHDTRPLLLPNKDVITRQVRVFNLLYQKQCLERTKHGRAIRKCYDES